MLLMLHRWSTWLRGQLLINPVMQTHELIANSNRETDEAGSIPLHSSAYRTNKALAGTQPVGSGQRSVYLLVLYSCTLI